MHSLTSFMKTRTLLSSDTSKILTEEISLLIIFHRIPRSIMDQDIMIILMDLGTPMALTQAIIMKPQDRSETGTDLLPAQT